MAVWKLPFFFGRWKICIELDPRLALELAGIGLWILKKNLVVKMNASLGSSVSDVPILTTPWHTKTQYILWSEMNGLLNQLSFFGHILSLQVTIDALNSLKNFLRIGSPWVCRQPRKSWDFMISSDLDCQISRIWMMKKKFLFYFSSFFGGSLINVLIICH